MHKIHKISVVISFILAAMMCFPMLAAADVGSWVPSDPETASIESSAANVGDFEKSEENKGEVSWIERTVGMIFSKPAHSLQTVLYDNQMDIYSVVMGRVKAGAGGEGYINYYTFEIEVNNIYAYVGAVGYAVLRGIVVLFIGIGFVYQLAKQALSVTAVNKTEIKDYLSTAFLNMLFLYLTPNIVDLMIFMRDNAIKLVADSIGAETPDFITGLWDLYVSEPGILNALFFLLGVIITFYFVFMYISNAFVTAVTFAFFPVVCMLGIRDKQVVSSWYKTMLGNILIPVIDTFLLFIPSLTQMLLAPDIAALGASEKFRYYGILVMELFILIPSRGIIRNLLGFGSAGAGEALGMGAAASAMEFTSRGVRSAKALAKGGGKAIGEGISAYSTGKKREKEAAKDLEGARSLAEGHKQKDNLDFDPSTKAGSPPDNNTASNSRYANNDQAGQSTVPESLRNDYYDAPKSGDIGAKEGRESNLAGGAMVGDVKSSKTPRGVSGRRAGKAKGNQAATQIDQEQLSAGKDVRGEQVVPADDQTTQPKQANLKSYEAPDKTKQQPVDQRGENLKQMDTHKQRINQLQEQKNKLLKNEADMLIAQANGISYKAPDGKVYTNDRDDNGKSDLHQALEVNRAKQAECAADISSTNNLQRVCTEKEEAYATQSAGIGMSGATYKTYEQYSQAKQLQEAKDQLANAKNYKNREYTQALTPQRKMELTQERYKNARRDTRIAVAGAVGRELSKGAALSTKEMAAATGMLATNISGSPRMRRVGTELARDLTGVVMDPIAYQMDGYDYRDWDPDIDQPPDKK